MKKRIFAAVMAAVMALSLTACGGATASDSSASDKKYVQDKGTLVVGITDFEPMDYKDANGDWVGFDADMAIAFGESLGVNVEFIEIDWDNKVLELNSKAIDCVWNGMTLSDEVKNSMNCSNAYCNNSQMIVMAADKADAYQAVETVKELTFAVEAGSAGEIEAKAWELNYTPVASQADALMEVAAGTSDAAVIDALMAAAMVGPGTSYENLTYTWGLNDEEYGVGFRQGSDLTEELNKFLKQAYDDGTTGVLADKYGVGASIIPQ